MFFGIAGLQSLRCHHHTHVLTKFMPDSMVMVCARKERADSVQRGRGEEHAPRARYVHAVDVEAIEAIGQHGNLTTHVREVGNQRPFLLGGHEVGQLSTVTFTVR